MERERERGRRKGRGELGWRGERREGDGSRVKREEVEQLRRREQESERESV